MKFHNLIEELFASRVKVVLLKTLIHFPQKRFSGREIARLVGLSPSRILEILNLFYKHGIVTKVRVGNSIGWTLNKESFLAKKLSEILNLDKEALRKLQETIKKTFSKNNKVLKVILFGSLVRGTEHPDSDIDVFILVKEDEDKEQIEQLIERLNLSFTPVFGNMISGIIYSEEEFKQKEKSSFINEIKKEGIVILECNG